MGDHASRWNKKMWPFKKNKRLEKYLADINVETAARNWFHGTKSFAKFLLRFDPELAERVIYAYTHQEGFSRYDPIEDDPEFEAVMRNVNKQIEKEFPKQRIGQCHLIWRRKKSLLKNKGINWLSPSELNPFNRYD